MILPAILPAILLITLLTQALTARPLRSSSWRPVETIKGQDQKAAEPLLLAELSAGARAGGDAQCQGGGGEITGSQFWCLCNRNDNKVVKLKSECDTLHCHFDDASETCVPHTSGSASAPFVIADGKTKGSRSDERFRELKISGGGSDIRTPQRNPPSSPHSRIINACPVSELSCDIIPRHTPDHATTDTVLLLLGGSISTLPHVFAKLNNEGRPLLSMEVIGPSMPSFIPAISHFFSCADHRVDYPGLFTFGGDLGEFINVCATIEDMSSARLGLSDVASLLHGYLEGMHTDGKEVFYACTDDQALLRLAATAATIDPLRPRSHLELERMLSLVDKPQFIGSKHIRSMLKDAKGYGVREDIVRHAVTSFMRIRLDRIHPLHSKVMLASLRAAPSAVKTPGVAPFIEIVRKELKTCPPGKMLIDEDCTSYPCGVLAPLVNPRGAAVVLHASDIEIYRAELARHFFPRIPAGDEEERSITEAEFVLNLIGRGSATAEMTRKRFYQDHDRFEVSFHASNGEDERVLK